MTPDELLDGGAGPIAVESVRALSRAADVFNIEVQGSHVYRIGLGGLLCHNNDALCPNTEGAGLDGGGVGDASRGPVSPRYFSESPEGIRLFGEANEFRGQLPGSATAKQYRNIAVADVIVDGQRRTVRFVNTPKSLHSEERLIQWYDVLKNQQGRDVKVLSVFSDRIPCGASRANCIEKLGEVFGQYLDVFFSIFKGPIQ